MRSICLAFLALVVTGCIVHGGSHHPHGMPPGQAKKMICNHSSSCSHFCLDDGTWAEIEVGHSHGMGCGHILLQGVWRIDDNGPGNKGKGKGKGKGKN